MDVATETATVVATGVVMIGIGVGGCLMYLMLSELASLSTWS